MSPTRVTVIDDDRDVLDLFHDVLGEFGYHVETFADAMPGIEELISSRPELIIVDLRLAPEREQLSGAQVIHSARSSAELRDIPIIVCSAATDALHDAWPTLMQRGDVQQLQKPFDLDTLQRVVETALGIGHGAVNTGAAGIRLAEHASEEQSGDR